MDLVADDRQVVCGSDRRDRFELSPRQYSATRVVRVAEQDHGRVRSSSLQTFDVQHKPRPIVYQPVFNHAATGLGGISQEGRVYRRLHDDAVAGLGEGNQCREQSLDDVGLGVGQDRVRPPVVAARHPFRKGLEEWDRVRHLAVAIVLLFGESLYRSLDARRHLEVHVGHEGR